MRSENDARRQKLSSLPRLVGSLLVLMRPLEGSMSALKRTYVRFGTFWRVQQGGLGQLHRVRPPLIPAQ